VISFMAVSVTGKTMLPVINSTKDYPFAAIEPLRTCFSNAYLRSLNAHMTVRVVSHLMMTFLTINRVVFKPRILKTDKTHAASNDDSR